MSTAPPQTTAPPADVFLRNMAALWRVDPALARRIDAVMDDQRLPVEPTRSGHWTAKVTLREGRSSYLHSRYDPAADAAKLLAEVDFDAHSCYLIHGFGLGYHVRAVHERIRGDAILVVFEPSVPVLATAFACVDLVDVIASQRLIILTNADKAEVHERLRPHAPLIMLGVHIILHPPSQQIAGPFHSAARTLFMEYVAYSRVSIITLVTNAQITCRNVANNLPAYVATPALDIVRNRFAGFPAIVVAAGPSLRKNIDQLPAARGRAVLIAVQTIYPMLRQRGIVPDFVVSLDYHEVSRQYFEGIEPSGDVHLVAEPKATWHVIDAFRGPTSLLDNAFARLLLGDALAARDGLPAGATVAHLAFYLARYMGCGPVLFIGQDLAYTGHVYYIPGVEMHQTWRSELNRFNTIEMKEWDRLARNREMLRKVQDTDGRDVYTDELLFTYLEQFEKDFVGCPVPLIDATEGGVHIRGTEAMALRDAMERFCSTPIPPERFAYRRTTTWFDPSRLQAGRDEVARRLEEVETVRDICDEMTGLLEELKTLTDHPDRFNRRLTRVDELRVLLRSADRAYRIITSATQLGELRRFKADREIRAAAGDSEAQRTLKQLDRDMDVVRSVREGVDIVKDMLQGALDRFDRVLAEGKIA